MEKMQAEKRGKGRVFYYDVLNVLATFCVVWIHFGNDVHWYNGSAAWYQCLFIQVVSYWAVPVFFMLSGATLMEYYKKYSLREFFVHRCLKTVIPYLFWGGVLTAWRVYRGSMTLDGEHLLASLAENYFLNKMEPIYWFFPAVFGIYLSMPLLSLLTYDKNRKILNYAVAAGIILVSVLPFCAELVQQVWRIPQYCWNGAMELPALGGYLIYPVLGYWAAKSDFTPRQRGCIYAGALASLVFRYWGLRLLSERDGATNQLFMNYKAFPALFLALGVFVLARYGLQRVRVSERAARFMSKVAACSFGVYLIHNMVLHIMEKIPFFNKYSVQWYFVWPVFCYIVCVIIIAIARKIPLVKKVVP